MKPFHLAITALKIIAALDDPGPAKQKVFEALFHILMPVVVILPMIVIELGSMSGVVWIGLLSKVCAVPMVVGMALWVARRVEK